MIMSIINNIRKFIFVWFLFSQLNTLAQTNKNNTIFKDYHGIVAQLEGDSVSYYTIKKHIYKLKLNNISYVGGVDSLKKDIYTNLKYEYEDNIRTLVFIFFDTKLNIKEIRFCELTPNHFYAKKGYTEYYKDYIRSIKKTKKKWSSKGDGCQVAMFSIHIH